MGTGVGGPLQRRGPWKHRPVASSLTATTLSAALSATALTSTLSASTLTTTITPAAIATALTSAALAAAIPATSIATANTSTNVVHGLVCGQRRDRHFQRILRGQWVGKRARGLRPAGVV